MRKAKKLLSILLTAAMVVSLLASIPLTAGAAGADMIDFTALHSAGVDFDKVVEGPQQLLVDNLTTKWCGTRVTDDNAWFIFDAGAPIYTRGYVIRGANDDMYYPSRLLHSWVILGSNSPDGPWTKISEPGAQGPGWTTNYQLRVFEFDDSWTDNSPFRYFRFEIMSRGTSEEGFALTSSSATMQFSYIGLTNNLNIGDDQPDPVLKAFLAPFEPGGEHYGQGLRADLEGDTVTITTATGSMATLDRTVYLDIPPGVVVDWKASVRFTLTNYNYSGSRYALLTVAGAGDFVLDKDAELEMNNWHNLNGNSVSAIRLENLGRKELNGAVTGDQMSGTLDMDVVRVVADGARISGTIKYTGSRSSSTALYSAAKTCEISAGAYILGRTSVNTFTCRTLIVSEDATLNGAMSGYIVEYQEPMPSDPYEIELGTSQRLELISGAEDTRAFWGVNNDMICITVVAHTKTDINDVVYFPVMDLPPDMEVPTCTVTLDFNGGTSSMQTVYEIPLCSTMPAPVGEIYPPAGKYTSNWGSASWVYTMSPRPMLFIFSYFAVTQDMTLTAYWIEPDVEYLNVYDLYAGSVSCDGQTINYIYQKPLNIEHSLSWNAPFLHDFKDAYASLMPHAEAEPYAAYDAGDGLTLVPTGDVENVDWTDPDEVAEYFFPGITVTGKQASGVLRDISDVGAYMYTSAAAGTGYETYKYNIGVDSIIEYSYVDGALQIVTVYYVWNNEYNAYVSDTVGTLSEHEPVVLHSITATLPEDARFFAGETLDLTDLEVLALYSNGEYDYVTGYTTDPAHGAELTDAGLLTIHIYYTEGDIDTATHINVYVAALAHVHNFTEIVVPPTCTEQGYTIYVCDCGEDYIDAYTDPLNHDWNEGTITKEPAEYEDGEITFTCLRCFDTRTETIPASGHTHDYIATHIIQPTCTEQGYTTYTCSCGEGSYDDDHTAALGHDFTVFIEHKDATCEESGYDLYKCIRCDETNTVVIPATGHSWSVAVVYPTCTDDGYTSHVCANDENHSYQDTFVNALGHDFSVEIDHKAPTALIDGYYIYKCSRCDETYRQDIPATGVISEYTVSFDVDGVITNTVVKDGEKVALPEEPGKDGYIFTGWYLGGEAFDFDTPITGDITLIAGWMEKESVGEYADISGLITALEAADPYLANYRKYTRATFNTLNSAVERGLALAEGYAAEPLPLQSQVEIDAAAEAVTDAIKNLKQASPLEQLINSILSFIDNNRGRISEAASQCRERIAQIMTCTISFDVDGVITSQEVYRGKTAVRPENPEKDGYTFDGWRVGSASGATYTFSSTVRRSFTLYAAWVEDPQEAVLVSTTPTAHVDKLNGNQNRLYITVIETYSDGTTETVEWDGLINNNAAGMYQVGGHKVYVDTKGNTQIRECYIVS
jgi:uncharacterized repeat protein (TIGR02543 family)